MNTEKTSVNWYAHGARYYDPQLAIWHSPDPLSELYTSFSPYHYVANNPVNFVDPNGMSQMSSQVHNQLDIENGRGNYNWEMANKMAGMMGSQFGGTSGGYEYSGNPGSGIEVGTHFDWRTGKNYTVYEDPTTGERYYRTQTGSETWWDENDEINVSPTYSYINLPDEDQAFEDISRMDLLNSALQYAPQQDFSGFKGVLRYLLTGGNVDGYTYNLNGVAIGITPIAGMPPSFIGGPLRKGQTAIKIGKYIFNPSAFHSVKQGVLGFAKPKNFAHLVGRNPDIMFKGGNVWLTGAKNSGFAGKTYDTGLSVLDFIGMF